MRLRLIAICAALGLAACSKPPQAAADANGAALEQESVDAAGRNLSNGLAGLLSNGTIAVEATPEEVAATNTAAPPAPPPASTPAPTPAPAPAAARPSPQARAAARRQAIQQRRANRPQRPGRPIKPDDDAGNPQSYPDARGY